MNSVKFVAQYGRTWQTSGVSSSLYRRVLPATQPGEQVRLILAFTADDIGVGGGGFGTAARPAVATYQSDAQRSYGDQAGTFLKLQKRGSQP